MISKAFVNHKYYQKVPPAQVEQFMRFRQEHPLKSLVFTVESPGNISPQGPVWAGLTAHAGGTEHSRNQPGERSVMLERMDNTA